MSHQQRTPAELARRMGAKQAQWPSGARFGARDAGSGGWRRESFVLPRAEARQKARDWFDGYPKAAYMTEIEFWRVCDDDQIEFTIRRLPSAD